MPFKLKVIAEPGSVGPRVFGDAIYARLPECVEAERRAKEGG